MDKALIVQIVVPIVKLDGKKTYQVGTGCAIGRDQILTARHVILPETGKRDDSEPIRIWWYHFERECKVLAGYYELSNDAILWSGKGKLDAALLSGERHAESAEIGNWLLSETVPLSGLQWRSRGFPKVSRSDTREHKDFEGHIIEGALTDSALILQEKQETFATSSTEAALDWAGASGMPVFCGGLLVGVVTRVLPDCRPPRFEAVPTALLLKDPDFKKKYIPPVPPDLVALAEDLIVTILEPGYDAIRLFANELQIVVTDQKNRLQQIACAILSMSLTDALDEIIKIQDQLIKSGDRKAVAVMAELALALLPAKHEDGSAIEALRIHRNDILIEVPCRSETVAEILLSAADLRSPRFGVLRNESDFPSGTARLARPPESGRDPQQKWFAEGIRRDLAEAFEPFAATHFRSAGTLEAAFREYLKVEFVRNPDWYNPPQGRNTHDHLEEIDEFIRDTLEERWESKRLAYYYILPSPLFSDGKLDNEVMMGIAALKRRYPRLSFLALEPGMPTRELKPYHKLKRLLYIAQENRS